MSATGQTGPTDTENRHGHQLLRTRPNHPTNQEGLHIGKHSGGWEFLWRAHPDLELTSAEAWYQFLAHPWVTIVAEYGVELTLSEFWEFAGKRPAQAGGLSKMSSGHHQFRDKLGFPFEVKEFC